MDRGREVTKYTFTQVTLYITVGVKYTTDSAMPLRRAGDAAWTLYSVSDAPAANLLLMETACAMY